MRNFTVYILKTVTIKIKYVQISTLNSYQFIIVVLSLLSRHNILLFFFCNYIMVIITD